MKFRASQIFALVRTLIFASHFMAGVLVYLPWAMGVFLRPSTPQPFRELSGIVVLVCGTCLVLYCILAFAWKGRGTPAPFDPPRASSFRESIATSAIRCIGRHSSSLLVRGFCLEWAGPPSSTSHASSRSSSSLCASTRNRHGSSLASPPQVLEAGRLGDSRHLVRV